MVRERREEKNGFEEIVDFFKEKGFKVKKETVGKVELKKSDIYLEITPKEYVEIKVFIDDLLFAILTVNYSHEISEFCSTFSEVLK